MLAENSTDSLRYLFDLYRASFDPEERLTDLDPSIDVVGLWRKIERELGVKREVLCEQIAGLTELPCHAGEIRPAAEIANKIPGKTLTRFHISIVTLKDGEPVIATANPLDPELLEALTFIFDRHYRLVIATPDEIANGIQASWQTLQGDISGRGVHLGESKHSGTEDHAVPHLAKQLMLDALRKNASDMHVQPFSSGSIVRIRVDGLLSRITLMPAKLADSMIRYFKAQSGMDPTLNLVPQDGRMLVEMEGHEYDLRISTLPVTGHKEKLVVRFLNRQSVYKLADIGFSLDEIHTLHRLAERPSGVVLVCGPTGSGKTTTLYSILSGLNKEDVSIMSVENPVEYQMQGLSQTEVNEKAGMTFARALRAILRQDPDVLLIGEIRDEETAQIAMQSALTGHLVFSTLHTNDSLSAIPRLLDLDVNPVILAESLAGIMSQRLLRTLCSYCKRELKSSDAAAEVFRSVTHVEQGFEAVGCERCNFSGYLGRTVVAEIVEINEEHRELLLGGEKDIAKFKAAMRGTFNSMSMAASRLIISGVTSATEASRVIGHHFWFALADEYKSSIPDMSGLSDSVEKNPAKNGVLIMGQLDASSKLLQAALEHSWLDVMSATDSSEAEQSLRSNENIDLVILELPHDLSEAEVIDFVAGYRRHLAWARLPAMLRIPAAKPEWEILLKEHGATSKFVKREDPVGDIVELIQHAINDKLDFKWGIDD